MCIIKLNGSCNPITVLDFTASLSGNMSSKHFAMSGNNWTPRDISVLDYFRKIIFENRHRCIGYASHTLV